MNWNYYLSLILIIFVFQTCGNVEWDDARINHIGGGWDILENTGRQSIYVLISKQQSDPDKPILTITLPEGVIMVNNPTNSFHMYAEVIDQSENIKDLRQISVSGGADFWKIQGSFSYDNKVTREFSSKMNHKVTRVNSYTTLAKFNLQTERLNLTSGIYDRIVQICFLLQKNTTNSLNYAKYIADQLINLYGTHIVISEDTGGILSKTDAVDISGYQNSVDQTISASASASFASYFKMSGQYSTEHSDVQTYSRSVTDSYISTIGGDPWKTNPAYTYDDWVESLKINPATIGLKLIYILDIINENNFKKFTFEDIVNVRNLLKDRLDVYLKNNYYKGCSDSSSSNYVAYANVFDDDLCNYQHTFHFAGLYTTSNRADFSVKNTITESYSCPTGFDAKQLLHLEFQGNAYAQDICHHNLFWKSCHKEWYYSPVITDTYICISSQNQTSSGMYFGGIYTESISNDITQDKTCPQKYIPYPIYHDAGKSKVTYVCVAPYDSGHIVSVPFGGIFSSQDPNYLVGNKPICADGFERHPVGSTPVTELTYCIGIGSLDNEMKNLIPPGYGNELTYEPEYFVLHRFENGTNVGIQVDPFHENNYHQQIKDLGISIFGNSLNINKKETQTEQHDCYLQQWLIDQNLLEITTEDDENDSNNDTSDSNDSNSSIKLSGAEIFVICMIPTIVVVFIFVGFIIYKKCIGKRREYIVIA